LISFFTLHIPSSPALRAQDRAKAASVVGGAAC
jgi:hypothetical protein